jgi:hypothetical protein
MISDDLKWSTRINNICNKGISTLVFLRHCSEQCRKQAYISLVRSTLKYGPTIWDSYAKGDIDQIERR